jgi:acetolactate synthase I/II/III large subunit
MIEAKNFSDLVVDYLEQCGVEFVFGIPGGHIAPLFEALARSEARGGIRAVLSRHESGAAAMADGYARETGKLGVCCATTGPGVTNLLTGVASAYEDNIPLLIITAQTLLPQFGQGAFQESSPDAMDTSRMFDSCTRYNTVITHPKQFERKLITALTHAFRGSPTGPVHLSIPIDQLRIACPATPSYPNLVSELLLPVAQIDLLAMERLTQKITTVLQQQGQIAVLVGHDCQGATEAITQFAELTDATIATTQRGKRWINPYHPLARGVFGFSGHQTARESLQKADLILAVGTTLGQWATSTWDEVLLNEKLVHLHACASYFCRSPMAQLHVQGTSKTLFEALIAGLNHQATESSLTSFTPESGALPAQIAIKNLENYHPHSTPTSPQHVVHQLMKNFPAETRVVVDTGNWMAWAIHHLFLPSANNFRISSYFAAMGWGIGAAVGTAIGTPKTPVVCLTGDGSFLMNGQEITVAVAEQLPVIFIILNDQSYGMVKHRHREVTDNPLEFDIPPVNFTLMAQAMGAEGITIRCTADLEQLDYQALCYSTRPTLLDIHIDREETPPIGMF